MSQSMSIPTVSTSHFYSGFLRSDVDAIHREVIEVGDREDIGGGPEVDAVVLKVDVLNRLEAAAGEEELVTGTAVVTQQFLFTAAAAATGTKQRVTQVGRDARHLPSVVQSGVAQEMVHPYGEHFAFSLANLEIR